MSSSETRPIATPSDDKELVEEIVAVARDALGRLSVTEETLFREGLTKLGLSSREAALREENARLREEATRYRALYERSKLPPRSKKSLSPDGGRDGE